MRQSLRKIRRLKAVTLVVFSGCIGLGCTTPDRVRQIGRLLDPVGEALDDYGTVSVSSPLLADVRKMEKSFAFELKKGPDDYYEIARTDVHGGLGVFSQRASDLRVGFQARVNLENLLTNQIRLNRFNQDEAALGRRNALQDTSALLGLLVPLIDPSLALEPPPVAPDGTETGVPTVGDALQEPQKLSPEQEQTARFKALIAALGGASQGVTGPTSRPAIPEFVHEPPEIDPNVLPNNDLVEQLIDNQKFANFLGLMKQFSTTQPAVLNRSALITAAGDSIVEALMNFLGRPVTRNDW